MFDRTKFNFIVQIPIVVLENLNPGPGCIILKLVGGCSVFWKPDKNAS